MIRSFTPTWLLAYAQLGRRPETFKYIQLAEQEAVDQSAILLATGHALLTLGDPTAALERFTRALDAPDANRVDVRIEFAKLFVHQGKFADAKQEVALAFAESRIGEASPVTADNLWKPPTFSWPPMTLIWRTLFC